MIRNIRNNILSGSSLEKKVGCSRAVQVGRHVYVSGTSPYGFDEQTVGENNIEAQMRRCIEFIDEALEQAGASLHNVVRTRVYLRNMRDFDLVAKLHHEYFSDIQPATTFLEVSGFVRRDWLIEIEAEAVVPD
jgi:enamine deaminase RidA (YjgF/YER057c/UK114 family)